MSKKNKRMAGQKLDERFGKGFTDRVKGKGMQEATDQGYSKRELLAEFRARPDDVKINEGEGNLVDRYQSLADSGTKFNKQAEDYLKGHGVVFNKPKEDKIADEIEDIVTDTSPSPVNTTAPINIGTYEPVYESSPVQTITTSPGSGGINVNSDNDIYSSIVGSDNNLSNFQDNSIMNSGDDLYGFMPSMNVNSDNDIYTDIVGNSNTVSNYQDNSIGNYSYGGDGLFAKRNPIEFKDNFLNNLFS